MRQNLTHQYSVEGPFFSSRAPVYRYYTDAHWAKLKGEQQNWQYSFRPKNFLPSSMIMGFKLLLVGMRLAWHHFPMLVRATLQHCS